MTEFTKLERAALHAIFLETPELANALERQLDAATVTGRQNTGVGFFTDISVSDGAARVNTPSVLGHATHARIPGVEHGLGFVLFVNDGRLSLLEGFCWGGGNTSVLDLFDLDYELYHEPVLKIG